MKIPGAFGKLVEADTMAAFAKIDKDAAEKNLSYFIKRAWKYIDPQPYMGGWHIDAICEHLQAVTTGEIKNLLINIPPRCSKSSVVSVAWPAWTWIQQERTPRAGPQVQFMFSSYAQLLAERDSQKTRRLIQSPWFQSHWGDYFQLTGDQNTKRRFENTEAGYRLATSVSGMQTGDGGLCHPAGTRILTNKGYVAIEKIVANIQDYQVVSYDINLKELIYSNIIASSTRKEEVIYEIRTAKGYKVRCTGEHPVYVEAKGYVPAAQLRQGDRVCITDRPPYNVKSTLRLLWQRTSEAALRCAQRIKGQLQRFLLLNGVQKQPSCNKEQQAVYDLWRHQETKKKSLLLACLQNNRNNKKRRIKGIASISIKTFMFGMREKMHANVLWKAMCKYCTFQTNERRFKFQLCTDGSLFKSISQNEAANIRKRQFSMHSLFKTGSNYYNERWASKNIIDSSSHRRKYQEQCTRKLDNTLSFLSYKASQWRFDNIKFIRVYRGRAQSVYDIQVERTNNFFAEGILVHNCLVVDDPHSAMEAQSETERVNTINWWAESFQTRLNNAKDGAKVVIMQRLHCDDVSGYILENSLPGEWEHLCLPMEYDPYRHCVTSIGWEDPRTVEGELLCPERFGREEVDALKHNMGSYAASGQLQQEPVPRGGGIIKREWWQLWPPEDYILAEGQTLKFPQFEFIIASVDTAFTKDQENDYSACTVWGVFRLHGLPKIMLVEAWKDRLEFHELVTKIIDTAKRRKIDGLCIEAKASGLSVIQEIRRLCGAEEFTIYPINPGSQDKVARMHAVVPVFEGKVVYAPDRKYAQMVIDEVESFPKGKHDDLSDTVSQALLFLRRQGIALLSTENARDIARKAEFRPYGDEPLYDV